LNGNVGVIKSMMGELTDSTNIAQGMALMPVVWSTGATVGYVDDLGAAQIPSDGM
jgi:hypothetical protein